jgi:hypothetical protein
MAALPTFLPRPTVTLSDPLDPSNVMSALATIRNDNAIQLRNLRAALAVHRVALSDRIALVGRTDYQTAFTPAQWANHTLNVDDSLIIILTDIIERADAGDIAIVVSYEPWILPIRLRKIFRFVTRRKDNGRTYWFAQPTE